MEQIDSEELQKEVLRLWLDNTRRKETVAHCEEFCLITGIADV